jgi:hypothetical protein
MSFFWGKPAKGEGPKGAPASAQDKREKLAAAEAAHAAALEDELIVAKLARGDRLTDQERQCLLQLAAKAGVAGFTPDALQRHWDAEKNLDEAMNKAMRAAEQLGASKMAYFEEVFRNSAGKRSDEHFYAFIDVAPGTSCEQFQILYLHREPRGQFGPSAVWVSGEDDRNLAYLDREAADRIAPEIDEGRVWGAMVKDVALGSTGEDIRVELCILRIAPEFERDFT